MGSFWIKNEAAEKIRNDYPEIIVRREEEGSCYCVTLPNGDIFRKDSYLYTAWEVVDMVADYLYRNIIPEAFVIGIHLVRAEQTEGRAGEAEAACPR